MLRAKVSATQPDAAAAVRTYKSARRYLAPLIAGKAYPPFRNDLPDYVKLQNVVMPKKRATNFPISI